jgi:hypothetical protein
MHFHMSVDLTYYFCETFLYIAVDLFFKRIGV